jgi:hypothetical protein
LLPEQSNLVKSGALNPTNVVIWFQDTFSVVNNGQLKPTKDIILLYLQLNADTFDVSNPSNVVCGCLFLFLSLSLSLSLSSANSMAFIILYFKLIQVISTYDYNTYINYCIIYFNFLFTIEMYNSEIKNKNNKI